MAGLQAASAGTDAMPAALMRTMDGRITFWSNGMEERYGYSADEAFGQISRNLLQTRSWQALDEIETALVERHVWHGGLIHHRADGQAVLAANRWHLYQEADSRGDIVAELHTDIMPPGTEAGGHLADVIAVLTQEVSQPLTAVGGYIGGAQRALRAGHADMERLEKGITAAIAQVGNAGEILSRFRALGDSLRRPRERTLNHRLEAALEKAETVIRDSAQARLDAARTGARVQVSRQARESVRRSRLAGHATISAHRTAAQENVAFLQRLLHRSSDKDAQFEQTILQLLNEAEANLARLDQQQAASC